MKLLIGSSLNAQINTGIPDRRKANIPVEFDRRQGDRRQSSAPVKNDRRRVAFAADNDKRKSDRRQVSIPVEIDRRQGDRRTVSFTNDKNQPSTHKSQGELLFEACEALPPVRRIKSLPDQIQNGNGTTALGMAALALINLPEDMRDIEQSAVQIKSHIKGKPFQTKYDYTEYQHPFSFFRGTMLDEWLQKNLKAEKQWALWLANKDNSLDKTNLCRKILKLMNVEVSDTIKTGIKNPLGFNEYATAYSGNFLGKLTARAMRRTTLLGLMAMSALEVPKLIHSFNKEHTLKEKAFSTSKQGIKSTINVASIVSGIGYMGALGAKYGGPTGSLVGMGLGAVLGSKLSQQAQKVID